MNEMSKKNVKELTMQELENISGGNSCDAPARLFVSAVCPICGFREFATIYEYVDGKYTELLHCGDCYNAFFRNEAGELVHYRRIMG